MDLDFGDSISYPYQDRTTRKLDTSHVQFPKKKITISLSEQTNLRLDDIN